MRFADNIFVQLRVPIPSNGENRFTRGHVKKPSRSRFMKNRQRPYEGFHDRRSGCYDMTHNVHNPHPKTFEFDDSFETDDVEDSQADAP